MPLQSILENIFEKLRLEQGITALPPFIPKVTEIPPNDMMSCQHQHYLNYFHTILPQVEFRIRQNYSSERNTIIVGNKDREVEVFHEAIRSL